MVTEKEREFKALVKENDRICNQINNILDDFNFKESKDDIWSRIYELVDNEIEQESYCGE